MISLNLFFCWKYGVYFFFFQKINKHWNVLPCYWCVLGYILMFCVFLWDSMSLSVYMNIFVFENFEMFEIPKIYFLWFVVQIKSCDALFRIEETKLVCAVSRKLILGWKTYFLGKGGPKMVLKLIQNGVWMILKWIQNGPKWSPPPHLRRQQKSPARGQQK